MSNFRIHHFVTNPWDSNSWEMTDFSLNPRSTGHLKTLRSHIAQNG